MYVFLIVLAFDAPKWTSLTYGGCCCKCKISGELSELTNMFSNSRFVNSESSACGRDTNGIWSECWISSVGWAARPVIKHDKSLRYRQTARQLFATLLLFPSVHVQTHASLIRWAEPAIILPARQNTQLFPRLAQHLFIAAQPAQPSCGRGVESLPELTNITPMGGEPSLDQLDAPPRHATPRWATLLKFLLLLIWNKTFLTDPS